MLLAFTSGLDERTRTLQARPVTSQPGTLHLVVLLVRRVARMHRRTTEAYKTSRPVPTRPPPESFKRGQAALRRMRKFATACALADPDTNLIRRLYIKGL